MSSEPPIIPPETLLAEAGWVRRLARRLVIDEAAADDVVQQTWERALQRTGEAPGQLRPWLGGIIRNIVRHEQRGAERRARREQAVAETESIGSTADLVARAELQQRLVSMVLELDEPYRSTVLRRYFEGLSPSQIARRDGIPASTVRNRLSRALDQLRQRFDRESGERRTWSLLLMPIAALGAERPATSLPKWPAIVGGILQVSTKSKLVAAAVGALLIAGALWTGIRLEWTRSDNDTAQGPATLPSVAPTASLPAAAASGEVVSLAPTGGDASAAPSAATSPFGTLVVEVVWAADGQPAREIEIRAGTYDETSMLWNLTMPSARTDAEGRCTFDNVVPGKAFVYPDRTESVTATVEAGKQTELRIELPAGITVAGTVVDVDGRSVAGADVWLSNSSSWSEGALVVQTDNAGRFTIPGLNAHCAVGASASGHGPSLLQPLPRDAESEVVLTIELTAPGGGIDGTVRGTDGSLVSGAVILLTPVIDRQRLGHDSGFDPLRRIAVSGADGRFHFEDVPAGWQSLRARARGWSPWFWSVEVSTASRTAINVVLQPPAIVTGRVINSSGSPIAGAWVGTSMFEDILVTGARSGDDGGFVLRDVASGAVTLHASTDVGSAKTTLQIAPGETHHWEAVLREGSVIRGRVLEADGTPAVACAVEALRQGAPNASVRSAMTDAEGRFTISKCRPGAHALLVHRVASWGPIPLVILSDVVPQQGDVTITLPPPDQAGGFIVGRVSLPPEGIGGEVSASLSLPDRNNWDRMQFDAKTGELHGGPYPTGTYRVLINCPGLPARVIAPVEVVAGATTDLGAFELAGPGRLTAHLRVEPGLGEIRLRLAGVTEPYGSNLNIEGNSAHSGPLVEGEYRLQVSGYPDVAEQSIPVRIEAGETTLDLTVERGARQVVEVDGVRPEAETLQIRVLDDRGELVSSTEFRMWELQGNQSEPRVSFTLKRGHYTVEVSVDGVAVLHESLDVTTLDKQGNWRFVIP